MKIRYSYTYKNYPDCYEATCYSKRRSEGASRMAMLGLIVLAIGIYGIIDIFTTCFVEGKVFYTIFDIFIISFFVYYFYYLLVLHGIITENEIAIIFTRAKYGWEVPVEIYTRIELMRIKNKKTLTIKTLKFSVVYIFVLAISLVVGCILVK